MAPTVTGLRFSTLTTMPYDQPRDGVATFRVAGPGDESDLLELWAGLDTRYFRPHPFTHDEATRITGRSGRDIYGMLMVDDSPVAYGLLRGWDEGFETPSLGIGVRVDHQGMGLGRLTMEHLHEIARAGGATTVRLRVHADNARARRLYESFGYVEHGADRGETVMTLDLVNRAAASSRPIGPFGRATKRAIDLVGATVALVVFSPVLAWVAVASVATQGRPILFRQVRPGLGGRPFTLMKFRTMRTPRLGEVWYLTDEARVTRLGRFLRASSIDELPELFNVLRGEMSLVGPRPLLVEYLDTYTPHESRRHDVRPGITGWAAVNGRHTLRFKERLQLDVWYVDHWSLRLDMRIIAMTIGQVLSRADSSTTQDLTAIGFPLATRDAAVSDAAMDRGGADGDA